MDPNTNQTDIYIKIINDLRTKYINNPYMCKRIHNHIINYLPLTIDSEFNMYEKRNTRHLELTNEQKMFIQVFLSKHQYYYLATSGFFYEYDNINYKVVKYDDIIHTLLLNITKNNVLVKWKHKTKMYVIKEIKSRNLFNSIPETETIQQVLNTLYPYIFTSKTEAKYFLTIIGDNLLKKKQELIFLVNNNTKRLITEIYNIANICVSSHISNNFMTKYHETHSYENCRLIKTNNNVSYDFLKDVIRKIGLNLLCVSAHYSYRYKDSDSFLETEPSLDVKTYGFYLKNTNQQTIVDLFCSQYIQHSNVDNLLHIQWKNIHFLWKQFIHEINLPSIVYSNTLKTLLKEKYEYDEKTDSFKNILSKFLPDVCDFLQFWDKTMVMNNDSIIDELELDEICCLFKYWVKQNQESCRTIGNINEDYVIKIIRHFFFPDVIIVEDKFVRHITNTLWSKSEVIENALPYIKQQFKESKETLLSFKDAYNLYCQVSCGTLFIVSKQYFEKYLHLKINKYVVYDNFITSDWANEIIEAV